MGNNEVQIKIRTQKIENLNESRYLGTLINNDKIDLKDRLGNKGTNWQREKFDKQ